MNKAFSLFSFCLLPLLLACGQKGALYLETPKIDTDKTDVFSMGNDKKQATPTLIQLAPLTISGQYKQLSQNTAAGWQAVLSDETNILGNNLNRVRYIVFQHELLRTDDKMLTMLIGGAEKREDTPESTAITAGTYLRFRNPEAGYTTIPSLLSTARRYFDTHPELTHLGKHDFMIETQQNIDLYIHVENRNP